MVHLPDNMTWVYWWDHSEEFSGTAEISRVPLEEYPVFFLKGNSANVMWPYSCSLFVVFVVFCHRCLVNVEQNLH